MENTDQKLAWKHLPESDRALKKITGTSGMCGVIECQGWNYTVNLSVHHLEVLKPFVTERGCFKNLREAELKSLGLMLLVEISRQPNIAFFSWLLVTTPMQIYNEKEQTEKDKIKYTRPPTQNV